MKILIIKLGAMGDVLRTTPLLTALKKQHPRSKIAWLVDARSQEVLKGNPLIDELIVYSEKNLGRLEKEYFDWALNLDKDEEALDAVMRISAGEKLGFGRSDSGMLCALDARSDYAYRLGVDDDLKFRKNKKTYQEISFEQAGLCFQKEDYIFSISKAEALPARSHLKKLGVDLNRRPKLLVGLNTGSGARFAGKKLPVPTILEIVRKFAVEEKATIFLLGGQDEVQRNCEIERLSEFPVVNTGSHPIKEFAAIVRECDLVISGDTTAMHIAIAVKVPVVAYFASTCAAEIELYGRGQKIISSLSCAPCYLKNCPINEQCMKDVSVNQIFQASKEVLRTDKYAHYLVKGR